MDFMRNIVLGALSLYALWKVGPPVVDRYFLPTIECVAGTYHAIAPQPPPLTTFTTLQIPMAAESTATISKRCLWYIPARRHCQRERRSLALAMVSGAKSTMIGFGLSRSLKPPTPSSCNSDSCSITLCTKCICLQQHSSSGTYLSIATRGTWSTSQRCMRGSSLGSSKNPLH